MSLILAGSSFTACNDDIELEPNGNYDNVEGVYGAVKNVSGARELSTITIFGTNTGTGQLYFELTEAASGNVTAQLKIDKDALDAYNAANGTSYEIYPEAQVTFANGGKITVASGSKKSEAVSMEIKSNGGVGKTYALPVSAQVTEGGVAVSKANQSYIYLIKPYGAIPDSDKGTGVKSILYIEVNDENILNAGEYTMAGSGKPFFDVVNIFAANINYNTETKRAYINCNENVSRILKNADQYIRPLQAKGIKVVLTILGNHDEAGVANLSPEAAADFARELKSYMDVYGLDGVDFDDEYSKYNAENPGPGFEAPSGAATARLVYECRKVKPDKIISVYDYTNYLPTGSVEGEEIGTLMDYSYWGAYANWRDRSSIITGLGKAKYGPSSFNLDYSASNGGYNLSHCSQLRAEGYGIQMFYNLKTRYDYSQAFDKIGNILFDDGVEWTGKIYGKTDLTGEVVKPSYDSYLGNWRLKPGNCLFHDGVYWQWGDVEKIQFDLRIEANVANESFKVYGWGGTDNTVPFIMNYNEFGRIEVNLPQTVADEDPAVSKNWTWVAFTDYNAHSSRAILTSIEPALSGYIDKNNSFVIYNMKSNFTSFVTMGPISNPTATGFYDIKGGIYRDVVYAPFTLTKQ
jgi:hypothetical protein